VLLLDDPDRFTYFGHHGDDSLCQSPAAELDGEQGPRRHGVRSLDQAQG
jgi:hypothetical protein